MQHDPKKIALFVDFDNIYLGLRETSREAAEAFATRPHAWLKWIEHGMPIGDVEHAAPRESRALIRQCYLNPDSFGKYRGYFTRAGFTVVDCPSLTSRGKNSSDIVMVMDILDALRHETRFDRFVIMSADADFTPVLQRLRAHDRRTAVMVGGIAAPAYRASCDKLIEEDVFIEHGLELVLAPEPMRGDAGSGPASGLGAVAAIRDPDLLAAIGQRVYEEASSGGTLPASELPRILREFKEFTPSSNWLGYYSLQGLTEAVLVHRPELRITDDDPWRIAVQVADEPVSASLGDASPPAADAEPHPDWDALRDRVVALVARMVAESAEPVVMGKAAQAAILDVGPLLTSTRWLGRGTFKSLLLSAPGLPFALVASPLPGFVFDPERHQPPSERAAVDGLAELGPEMASLVRRMNQLTDTPRLTPRQYRVMWEVMAKELGRAPYNLMGTGKAVRDQCVERGEPIARQAITWVLRGLGYVGYRFDDRTHHPENLAAAYRGNLLNILRQAQVTLSDEELRTLDEWLLSAPDAATQPAAPPARSAAPPASRRRSAPVDPDAASEPDYAAWADALLAGEARDRRPPFTPEPASADEAKTDARLHDPSGPMDQTPSPKDDDFVWPPPDALLFEPDAERQLRKRADIQQPPGALFFESTEPHPHDTGANASARADSSENAVPVDAAGGKDFADAPPIEPAHGVESSESDVASADAGADDAPPVTSAADSESAGRDAAPADEGDADQPAGETEDAGAPPSDEQHPAVGGEPESNDGASPGWRLSTDPAQEPDAFPWETPSESPSATPIRAEPAHAEPGRMDDGDFIPAGWQGGGDSPPDEHFAFAEPVRMDDGDFVPADWRMAEDAQSAAEPDDTAHPAMEAAPGGDASASAVVEAEWQPAEDSPPADDSDSPAPLDAIPDERSRADDAADGAIVTAEWQPADTSSPAGEADAAAAENAAPGPSTASPPEPDAAVASHPDDILHASWEPAADARGAAEPESTESSSDGAEGHPGAPDASAEHVVTPQWEAAGGAQGSWLPAAEVPVEPAAQMDAFPLDPPRDAAPNGEPSVPDDMPAEETTAPESAPQDGEPPPDNRP